MKYSIACKPTKSINFYIIIVWCVLLVNGASKCPNFGKLNYTCRSFDYCDSNIGLVCGNGDCDIPCPNDWIFFNQSCYYPVMNVNYTYYEAQAFCKNYNANILTAKSQKEMTDVRQALLNNSVTIIWLSAMKSNPFEYTWPDGTKFFSYDSLWTLNEPNNCNDNEMCVVSASYRISDYPCSSKFPFICEIKQNVCKNTYCRCQKGTYYNYDKCVPFKTINESCTYNNECNSESSLQCINKKCACSGGTKWYSTYDRCSKCPLSWIYYNDKCYFIDLCKKSYSSISSWCQRNQGNLIMPKENDTVFLNLLTTYMSYIKNFALDLWVGTFFNGTYFLWDDNTIIDDCSNLWCSSASIEIYDNRCVYALWNNSSYCLNFSNCSTSMASICESSIA